MRTGRIVRWLKNDGDRVEKGEAIVIIETEKVTFEVEAEQSGTLSKIMAQAGDEVSVGTTIAYILNPGEQAPEVSAPPTGNRETQAEAPPVTKGDKAIKASPLAKKIAEENNIDLSLLTGTGPEGRITKEDILQAVEERKTAPAPPTPPAPAREKPELAEEELVPLSSMRKVIAKRMTESFEAPHFYVTVEVDTQELRKTREQLIPLVESKTGIRLTITDLIIKMVAKVLEENPLVNSSFAGEAVKLFKRVDIGLVTSVEGGLLAPVIRQANKKSLTEIAQARAELVQKTRDHKLSMEEMRGSTFTISNMGMFEVDQFSAIIQPPEAAILAMGRIADRAVVRNGEIVIRPMMTLTLSIDHRVLDAVMGANFLKSLKDYLENPVTMLVG